MPIGATAYGRAKQRNNTEAGFDLANPVPAAGEILAAIDGPGDMVVKIGDGTSQWDDAVQLYPQTGGGGGASFAPVAANNFPGNSEMAEQRITIGTPYRRINWIDSLDSSGWFDPYGGPDPTWVTDAIDPGTPTVTAECWFQYELSLWMTWATDPGWVRLSARTGDGNASGWGEVSGKAAQSNAGSSNFESYLHLTSGPILSDGNVYFPIKVEWGDVAKVTHKLTVSITRLT